MDQLQEYYEAIGDEEQGITSPEVGMNCAAFFAGLLHFNQFAKKWEVCLLFNFHFPGLNKVSYLFLL